MSRGPFEGVMPEHLRRAVEGQGRQMIEVRRALEPSIQAAQDALKAIGVHGTTQAR